MSTIKHQTSFEINQPIEELFPLFSAEGEKLWAPGWDYENIMGSTDMHEDYIFLTSNHHSSDDHGSDHHRSGHHSSDHHRSEYHRSEYHRSGHHGSAHHGATKMIWLVKRYEPSNYFVQFYRVEPDNKVGIVTVHCKPITEELTEVEVAYEFIGLSEKGDEFIKGYTAEVYEEFIGNWPKYLADYFETKSK
jgi:hypothetical protein